MEAGFKRLYRTPKRALRGMTMESGFSARGKYLRERSLERYQRRADAYDGSGAILAGEIGSYENIRFITDAFIEEPK